MEQFPVWLPVWCDSFHLKGWSCGGLMPPPVVDRVVSTSPPNEAVGNANRREGGEPLLHRSKEAIAGSHTHLHFNPFDPYNRYKQQIQPFEAHPSEEERTPKSRSEEHTSELR